MTKAAKKIIEAIGALFSDTSVDRHVTLDDLEEIGIDVAERIDAIKEDIKRDQRGES